MSDPVATSPVRSSDKYFVVADGIRLHYRDYPGSSAEPPLLCLHGLTRNARDFVGLAERFSPHRRVLALDFRGRGRSGYDPLPLRYTPLTYATDVIALLDELKINEAVFVGTSLGGLVTMVLAATAPQRIAAAILNDVGPELNEVGLERIRTYVGNGARFRSWDEAAEAIAANNGHVPASYSHSNWVEMAHRVCREDNGEIVFDYDMAIALPFETQGTSLRVDMWPLFEALGRKPLLVIRGELSDLLSAASLAKMQSAVPGLKSVTVPGVGHAPMLDEPEALAAIDRFVASLG
jgi:pimeloyl-ACP methyl ester carboxylesterase